MGIADALGSLVDVETPRRRDVQTAKRSDAQTPRRSDVQAAKRSGVETARRPELPLQGTAKSRHPDFAKKTLYIRKSTMRDALRRYEDGGGSEESELVERLLLDYIRRGFHG